MSANIAIIGNVGQLVLDMSNNQPKEQILRFLFGYQSAGITALELAKIIQTLFDESVRLWDIDVQINLLKFIELWVTNVLIPHDASSISKELIAHLAACTNTNVPKGTRSREPSCNNFGLLMLKLNSSMTCTSNIPFVQTCLKVPEMFAHDYSHVTIANAITHSWTLGLRHLYVQEFYKDESDILSWFSSFFNHLSMWVAQTIVNKFADDYQSNIVNYFLKLIKHLRSQNDFNGMMAIVAGINNVSVQRLQTLWNTLSKRECNLFEEVDAMCSPRTGYSTFRAFMTSRKPPAMPYIAMYLSDIQHIKDSKSTFVVPSTEKVYNVERIVQCGERLVEFYEWTHLLQCPCDIDSLSTLYYATVVSEDELYIKSLSLQSTVNKYDWDITTWTISEISNWAIVRHIPADKTNEFALQIKKCSCAADSTIITHEQLKSLGIKSLQKRKYILQDLTNLVDVEKHYLTKKPLVEWDTTDLCSWMVLSGMPIAVIDTMRVMSWGGSAIETTNFTRKIIRDVCKINNLSLCADIANRFENLKRICNGSQSQLFQLVQSNSSTQRNILRRRTSTPLPSRSSLSRTNSRLSSISNLSPIRKTNSTGDVDKCKSSYEY